VLENLFEQSSLTSLTKPSLRLSPWWWIFARLCEPAREWASHCAAVL
jgi:hypothetical protein